MDLSLQGLGMLVVVLDVWRLCAPSLAAVRAHFSDRIAEGGKAVILDSKRDKVALAAVNITKSFWSWTGLSGLGEKLSSLGGERKGAKPEESGSKIEIRLDRTQNESKT